MEQSPYLVAVYFAISVNGGIASLEEIYAMIMKHSCLDLDKYTDWKSVVRRQIYHHSSDADLFKGVPGDSSDLFYAVYEKGDGVWGIRS